MWKAFEITQAAGEKRVPPPPKALTNHMGMQQISKSIFKTKNIFGVA